jgi:membrane associated rhomboid family serine protease
MFPLYDTVRSRKFPIVNWTVIILNGLAFYYEWQLAEAELNRFIHTWGLIPVRLIADPADTWITIFSSMFLHGGWFHLLSNMWILVIFGDNIEERFGSASYLIFYLFSGIAAALLDVYISPGSSVPTIGASGAIAGVLGAYLIQFPRARVASLVPIIFIFTIIELPAVVFLGFWFVLQLFSGWLVLHGADVSGGIAWWAHIGGFIFGMLTSFLFVRRQS